MKAPTLLVLGSMPPPIGGTTLLFQQLVERLIGRADLRCVAIDTRAGASSRFKAGVRLAVNLPRADLVVLNASPPGIAMLGPALIRTRRPVVLRLFGGDLDLVLERGDRRLDEALAEASLVLVETDQNAEWIRAHRPDVRLGIQRNSRVLPAEKPGAPRCERRFAFVGRICGAKGMDVLAESARALSASEVRIDLYGRFEEAGLEQTLAGIPSIRIHGEVPHARIPDVIARCDALVLPTRHEGEGHPGAVLEAFAARRPIIATRHRAVPELVRDGVNGLLVPVGDAGALTAAIRRLAADAGLLRKLADGAWQSAAAFDADRWSERFVEHCFSVLRSRRAAS